MTKFSQYPQLLHWVFKIANLEKNLHFYKNIGCSVQRHEEFQQGCEAQCNGAYARPWSKTMIGHGNERENFVFELTFNYGIRNYQLGNDFECIDIKSESVADRSSVITRESQEYLLSPDGYQFRLVPGSISTNSVLGLCLNVASLDKTIDYWVKVLGMTQVSREIDSVTLKYPASDVYLRFKESSDKEIFHKEAYGRIAVAVALKDLDSVEASVKAAGHKIHTPRVTLPTPGKADVDVIILSDPDDYEICFVGSEGFFELAQPTGDTIDWEYRKEFGGL